MAKSLAAARGLGAAVFVSTVLRGAFCLSVSEEKQLLLNYKASQFVGALSPLASWDAAADVCEEWIGVSCTLDGRVKSIDLSSSQLSGPLPVEWGDLTRLSHLNLEGNALTGDLPESWSTLDNMVSLVLAGNSIRGSAPAVWNTMVRLLSIDISNNDLTGDLPVEWSSLPLLSSIDLGHNALRGSLKEKWFTLQKLTFLSLKDNEFTGTLPPEYSFFQKLTHLDLSHNKLTGTVPQAWTAMAGLRICEAKTILEPGNNLVQPVVAPPEICVETHTVYFTLMVKPTWIWGGVKFELLPANTNATAGDIKILEFDPVWDADNSILTPNTCTGWMASFYLRSRWAVSFLSLADAERAVYYISEMLKDDIMSCTGMPLGAGRDCNVCGVDIPGQIQLSSTVECSNSDCVEEDNGVWV